MPFDESRVAVKARFLDAWAAEIEAWQAATGLTAPPDPAPSDPKVVAAIRALRDSKDPRAPASIEPLLKHADPSVQKAAQQALESP